MAALLLALAPKSGGPGIPILERLRKGVRFHNGDPVTADDVKFSFERYRGTAASTYKARIAAVDVVDPQRVRFRFKQPWPDFMTFYGTPATGAA